MPSSDDNLLQRLLVTFRGEAEEHVQTIASGLVQLEKTAGGEVRGGLLDTIFRAAHSLKGAARAVNLKEVEMVCQALESVFASLKRSEIQTTPELFDLLQQAVTVLGQQIRPEGPGSESGKPRVAPLIAALKGALKPAVGPTAPTLPTAETSLPGPQENPAMANTIRVATTKLDAMLWQAEEMLTAKLALHQHAAELRPLQLRLVEWKKKWAQLQPELRALQQAFDRQGAEGTSFQAWWGPVAEFLEWNQTLTESLQRELAELGKTAEHDQRFIGLKVDDLLDEMKKMVMLPFAALVDLFPRFVRELSREQGKEINLVIRGGEIEIDRRILEEMKDPLIHLVRNCLDHGLESPQRRAELHKPAQGTILITLSALQDRQVELSVSDDGAGLDIEKVKAIARQQGLLTPEREKELSEEEARRLIFESGFSTSPIVTDLSGRGLGLAIVKEKVEKLNGVLTVESTPGQGTSFKIILPLTLSRFHGVIVRVQERLFLIPASQVERVLRVRPEEIKTMENRETIALDGQALSLVRLSQILELPQAAEKEDQTGPRPALVLATGGQRLVFLVDEILDQKEVLVKPLGRQLIRVRNMAGATILGDGRVVPILNVPDLIKSAIRASASGPIPLGVSEKKRRKTDRKKSVLVAEDSITSRTLLKNILEAAGYQVETAVDGIDALTKLRSQPFDLVVSDVEMPRLDGFGLTEKIRADKKLAEYPVVLVTALDSRTDREHGIDVGANAYLVKSSFDQSNLLEIVRRLL
jgi:two-component system chemotaxis sensor kinase CheA